MKTKSSTYIPKWLKCSLKMTDLSKIEELVIQAEHSTSCEIVPMVVRRSSATSHVPVILFCLLTILFLIIGGSILHLYSGLTNTVAIGIEIIVASLVSRWLSRYDFFHRQLTADQDLLAQVQMRAEVEFFEAGLNKTHGRTGILIFVSLMEHKAVVLADQAVAEKLPSTAWRETLDLLLVNVRRKELGQGFCEAIEHCRKLVTPLFPGVPHNLNELANTLIVKE